MKNFNSQQSEPVGQMINRIRAVVKGIPIGATVDVVLDVLGEPDNKTPGLLGYLPANAQKNVNATQSLIEVHEPIADETWIYVNPYRSTIMHFLAISGGKVERVWEVQKTVNTESL